LQTIYVAVMSKAWRFLLAEKITITKISIAGIAGTQPLTTFFSQ